MLAISIQATGETLEDLEYALEDIIEKFANGMTSGIGGNINRAKGSNYTFEISGREEKGDNE